MHPIKDPSCPPPGAPVFSYLLGCGAGDIVIVFSSVLGAVAQDSFCWPWSLDLPEKEKKMFPRPPS